MDRLDRIRLERDSCHRRTRSLGPGSWAISPSEILRTATCLYGQIEFHTPLDRSIIQYLGEPVQAADYQEPTWGKWPHGLVGVDAGFTSTLSP